jgi:hypothetical protein
MLPQVQPAGRDERGRVQQHPVAVRRRQLRPLQRVLGAGEVGLGGEGEEVVPRRVRGGEPVLQVAHAQLLAERHVHHVGAAGRGELAQSVDGVVVVCREQEAAAGLPGKALPTSLRAPLELRVKTTSYCAGSALKKSRTRARAASTSSVAARDVGLRECGLPKTPAQRKSAWARTCDSA